jgi:hypothetical protein
MEKLGKAKGEWPKTLLHPSEEWYLTIHYDIKDTINFKYV